MDVPCGKCAACLTNRRNDWSLRLAIELDNSHGAHFITLTYNDENIPTIVNCETGEIIHTVIKKDLQNYIKRLRKNTNVENLRYYAVGEYGTKTMRPHYHVLLFNLPQNKVDYITTCWNAKGFTKVGTVTPASIHYVTKYHVNKTHFPESAHPSFTLMSRKPGIGHQYVDKFKTFHQGNINRAHITQLGGEKRRLPRYLKDNLYTKAERSQIASKYEKMYETIEEKKQVKHEKNNPCKNFYELKEEEKLNFSRQFKNKINEKDTF